MDEPDKNKGEKKRKLSQTNTTPIKLPYLTTSKPIP